MSFENVPLAWDSQIDPLNESCFDYFIRDTESMGEYTMFSFKGREHKKSEFVADIEAMAAFFSNEIGLKKGDVFSAFVPTSVEGMITFYALNKIGVIVNFIHPLLPSNQLEEIIVKTKPSAIMMLDAVAPLHADLVAKYNLPLILLVMSCYALPDKYAAKANSDALAAAKAKVERVYTYPEAIKLYAGQVVECVKECGDELAIFAQGGGTTGKSRTIMITNNNLNWLVRGIGSILPVNEAIGVETELCCMPFFHCYGLVSGGLSAIHGGRKVIFMPKFDAEEFVDILQKNHVTQFNGVPNMFKKLIRTPGFDGPHLKYLKVMYCGGDDVRPEMADAYDKILSKYGSHAQICAGWGLTECCASCAANYYYWNKIGTVGHPIRFVNVEVWDPETNEPVKQGEIGQLVVSGPTVMAGYLEESKDERNLGIFFKNGERYVLTGDMAKLDEDGFVVFVGRIKRLIIISGYNIYPNDIEKLLEKLPYIHESCAVQGYDENGKVLVRLYVVADNVAGNEEKYTKEIQSFIGENLDKFSVPRDVRFIDELPRTPVGKVDFLSLTEFKNV